MTQTLEKINYWERKPWKMVRCPGCGHKTRAGVGCCTAHFVYEPSQNVRPVTNPFTGAIKLTQIPYIMPQAQRLARKSGYNKKARQWVKFGKSLTNA